MTTIRDGAARVLTINRKAYLENMLKRFGIYHCKSISEAGQRFERLTDGENIMDRRAYQGAIGYFTNASLATRPDLSAAMGVLSQFMANQGPEHRSRVKSSSLHQKSTISRHKV